MIDFYTYKTINGLAVEIALEEMELEYNLHTIDLFKGEQKNESFLKISPSGRIPVIVDNDTQITLSQSIAILIYLAEKSNLFLSKDLQLRAKTLEWLMFHATDMAPNLYNNFYLKALVKPTQKEAAVIIKNKFLSLYDLFNDSLSQSEFITGAEYTIADIATFPSVNRLIDDFELKGYTHLIRWHDELKKRPAIKHVLDRVY